MNKTLLIVLGVVVVLGGLFFLFGGADNTTLTGKDPEGTANNTNGTPNTSTNTTVQRNNTVLLRETTTGNSVVIQTAELTVPGYVVIYRGDSNGKTTILGKSDLLKAGEYNILPIQLDSIIAKDQVIVAVLHGDDGDGVFEVPGADAYLTTGSELATDVDVVDVPFTSEPAELRSQAAEFFETTADISTTTP